MIQSSVFSSTELDYDSLMEIKEDAEKYYLNFRTCLGYLVSLIPICLGKYDNDLGESLHLGSFERKIKS